MLRFVGLCSIVPNLVEKDVVGSVPVEPYCYVGWAVSVLALFPTLLNTDVVDSVPVELNCCVG